MLKRYDRIEGNTVQNRFTAMLKVAVRNKRIDYIKRISTIKNRELFIEDSTYRFGEESKEMQTILDYDLLRSALKSLTERERNIIVFHLIEDKNFEEVGRQFGLSYKAAAAAFYRAVQKLRTKIGRYYDGF